MKRYCIVCENIFGCIQKGRKNVCCDCDDFNVCGYDNDIAGPHVTGGICQECWEKRHLIKTAVKIYNIAKHLNLKPANSGIKGISSVRL